MGDRFDLATGELLRGGDIGRNDDWLLAKTLGGFRRLHREHRGLPETLSTVTIVLGHIADYRQRRCPLGDR